MPPAADPPPVQPHLLALPGYDPVTPLDQLAARAGVDPADVLKLDANENPFGTSDAVRQAIAAPTDWSIYPDPLQLDLRADLSDYVGVPAERIVAGAGSDELIELTVRACVAPGQRVLSCPPTFGMYRFLAGVANVPLDEVERRPDFSLDLQATLAAIAPDTALVILASPNNPSGTPLSHDELAAVLDTGATIAVDEAYSEYAGASFLDRFPDHPRLVVFRTFSKWAGLAGLRAGYGVFHPDLAAALMRIKQPYNVNAAAEVAMRAALAAKDDLLDQAAQVVAEREAMFRDISALGWLTPYPSAANFLLCEITQPRPDSTAPPPPFVPSEAPVPPFVPSEALVPPFVPSEAPPPPFVPGEAPVPPFVPSDVEGNERASPSPGALLQAALAKRGVFIRYFNTPRLETCVRISCPRPDQHDSLMQRLRDAGADLGLG